jgi:hypothetical protein
MLSAVKACMKARASVAALNARGWLVLIVVLLSCSGTLTPMMEHGLSEFMALPAPVAKITPWQAPREAEKPGRC